MIRVNIIAEGQTESTFINEVLEPVLRPFNLWPRPCLIGRPGHKGGNVSRDRVRNDALRLLKGDESAYCTTMLDFFRLDADFPGLPVPPNSTTARKADIVQKALYEDIANHLENRFRPDRFIPYIQMHEFEGLLFSDPAGFAKGLGNTKLTQDLALIRAQFGSPEDINDGPATAPSKRIDRLCPEYDKPIHGSLAAIEIGLDAIRRECPHFDEWVTRLEKLGSD